MNNITYKDPIRKIGSQSETPELIQKNETIYVGGYQIFTINQNTKSITLYKKQKKFNYINDLLKLFNKINNCSSIVDIGCSSGLVSFIALNNDFNHIVSLDHDQEYIETLNKIKTLCNITKIKESVFSFGNKLNETFDIVFCGAIIHWIFSLTADFRNFDSIISYLNSISNKYLILEWIEPEDSAIKHLNHIQKRKKNDDEDYTTENFEKALKKYTKIKLKHAPCESTRIFYILEKLS